MFGFAFHGIARFVFTESIVMLTPVLARCFLSRVGFSIALPMLVSLCRSLPTRSESVVLGGVSFDIRRNT